jgi:hypothetical protein
VLTFDPAHGVRENALAGFMTEWESAGEVTLVVMPPGADGKDTAAVDSARAE